MKLQEQLNEKKKEFEATASDDIKKMYAEGIAAVSNNGFLTRAINVDDKAPEFALKNATGATVSLSDYLAKGPVVLTWYRGGWCPYCNITLQQLQRELPKFIAEGAHLLALTPELPDNSISTKEKNELTFEVLSDVGNAVANKYGITYRLIEGVAAKYQASFDMHGHNGDTSDELPLAATYVIDQQGIVKYAFLDAEYRNRAEPSEILEVLQGLK